MGDNSKFQWHTIIGRCCQFLLIIFSMVAGYAVSSLVNYRKFQEKERIIEKLRKELEENNSL